MRTFRYRALSVALLLVLSTCVYWDSLGGTFVYDDHRFVANNLALRSPENLVDCFTDPTTVDPEGGWEGIYRPLRSLSYVLDCSFFGTNPVGFRIHSLLIHVAVSVALSVLLGAVLGRPGLGLALGCAYAVHPVHVESVAWVTSRADLQSGLFSLLTLLAMRRKGMFWTWMATLLFALALFSKESAVLLPVLGLLLNLVLPPRSRRSWKRELVCWIPAILLVAVYWSIRMAVLGDSGGQRPPWGGTRLATLAYMIVGGGWYLWRLLLPVGFQFDFQLQDHLSPTLSLASPGVLCLGGGLLLGISLLTLGMVRGGLKHEGTGIWWLILALGPVSNVAISINILVAERFLYLPAAGLFLALGGVYLRCHAKRRGLARIVGAAAVFWIAFLGATTRGMAAKWRNEEALWHGVLHHSPGHFRAYHGLAKARILAGDPAGAREALVKAIGYSGGKYPDIYFDLGRVCMMVKQHREALVHLRCAADLWRSEGATAKNRRYLALLQGLEDLYRQLGETGEAEKIGRWLKESLENR